MTPDKMKKLWFLDGENQKLQELLADPTLVRAITIVKALKRPSYQAAALGNDTIAAHLGQYQAGIFDAFAELEQLAEPEILKTPPQPRTLTPE